MGIIGGVIVGAAALGGAYMTSESAEKEGEANRAASSAAMWAERNNAEANMMVTMSAQGIASTDAMMMGQGQDQDQGGGTPQGGMPMPQGGMPA